MDWDNIKIFITVKRAGSVAQAAKELGINHSTVLRRITTLEQELKVQLFQRLQSGYEITPAGETILEPALLMEQNAIALQRQAASIDCSSMGSLTVTTPPTDFLDLMPLLAQFQRQSPNIRLNIDAHFDIRDLEAMEADVCIRMTNKPPEHYVGSEVLRVPFLLYASRNYIEQHGPFDSIADIRDWIVIHIPAVEQKMEGWVEALHAENFVNMRVNSLEHAIRAAESDHGVTFLPQHLAERSGKLVRIHLMDPKESTYGIWLMTRSDLRFQPRVSQFMEFMRTRLPEQYPDYAVKPSSPPANA